MDVALEIKDVTKVYDGRTVVDHVSLAVEYGETFGLLGPNGSGKTTTIRMALDIIRPESGSVSLLGGMSTRKALARVGYLPEERGLYQKSKVIDILVYLGRLKRMDAATARANAREMLQRVGLYEYRNKKVQALSRGMTQLVQFSGALLHKPELIILDEPFAGLDPLNVRLMKEILREQKKRGAAIVSVSRRNAGQPSYSVPTRCQTWRSSASACS
jgi:ABC-2 type transport system ATP-binding protein